MNTIVRIICWAFTLASIASIFCWAAFDYSWWVPIKDIRRELAILLFHVFGAMTAPAYEAFPRTP
jgi:hypothetical protein